MNTNEKKWIRINEVTEIYGIKKTTLYKLLKTKIESKLISPRIRLVSVHSIETYLNNSK